MATALYVFKSELVNFEGTFGGYLSTACSSDVCIIPTKCSFFVVFSQ